MIVHTKSGSKYSINEKEKTWNRLEHDPESSHLRTEGGSYNEIKLRLGYPME